MTRGALSGINSRILQNSFRLCTSLSVRSPVAVRKFRATERRASCGHSLNQSIVQQFTSDGNIRSRVRNASPMGLMHMHTCKLARTRLKNSVAIANLVTAIPLLNNTGRMAFAIMS